MKRGVVPGIVILILILGGLIVASQLNLLPLSVGGLQVLSISEMDYNSASGLWTLEAVHARAGQVIETQFTGSEPDSPVLIYEQDYSTSCRYEKSVRVDTYYVIKGGYEGIYDGNVLSYAAVENIKRIYPEALNIVCAPSSYFLLFPTGHNCWYSAVGGDVYNLDNQHMFQFNSRISVKYSGQETNIASLDLSNLNDYESIMLNGRSVGTVRVVGSLNALEGTCTAIQDKWLDFADGHSDIGTVSSAYTQAITCMGLAKPITYDAAKRCYSTYIANKPFVSTSAYFPSSNLVKSVDQSYFSYVPVFDPINIVYSITLDSDWIKVLRPVPRPSLKDPIVSSTTTRTDLPISIQATLCNDATAGTVEGTSAGIKVSLTCDNSFPDSSIIAWLAGGECKSVTLSSQPNCNQGETTSACLLTALGTEPVDGTVPKAILELPDLSCTPVSSKCIPGSFECNDEFTMVMKCDSDGFGWDPFAGPCNCGVEEGSVKCLNGNYCPDHQVWDQAKTACIDRCDNATEKWNPATKTCDPTAGSGWLIYVILGIIGLAVVYFAYTAYAQDKV